jgi:type-F conjugative transfer system pilin assembly protein TrbC
MTAHSYKSSAWTLRVSLACLATAATLVGSGASHAQQTKQPTAAQIDAAMARQAKAGGKTVSDVDIARIISEKSGEFARAQDAATRQVQGTPSLPTRRAPDIKLNTTRPADLEAFYNTKFKPPGEHHEDGDPVMVFVSFSMPYESLKRVARDAGKAKIPLVFQGLKYGLGKDNMRRGVEALSELRSLGANIEIHPDLFEYYDIKVVPAVVVAGQPKADCSDPVEAAAPYIKVYGDVTLDYALEHIEGRKDELGKIARAALDKIQAN